MDNINKEINRCVLCHDAPCKKIYKNVDPERIIRALKFNNKKGAYSFIKSDDVFEKNTSCDEKCPLDIDIDKILKDIISSQDIVIDTSDVDISTDICGVKLENPFLLSSSIIGSRYEMCKRAFEYGWAGVCVKTISMMKIEESSPRFSALKGIDGTFAGFKNIEQLSEYSVEDNMKMIRKLKEEFPSKVIIASIMGRNEKEWKYLAQEVTKAGADIIELNFSCPNMKHKGTGSDVGQDPTLVKKYTKVVKNNTTLPILAKMTPNITDMRVPALAAKKGGAKGISAINTIKSITGVDVDNFVPEPQLNGSGIGGIYTWHDAAEFMLLGCSSVQMTTAVMEYGYRIIDDLILGLKIYMKEKNYKTVYDFIGLAKNNLINNDQLDKETILVPMFDYEKCVGCGRCYISCRDGGHNAIKFDENRKPILDGKKCVGCHLCKLVCPNKAIKSAPKRITISK